MGLKDAVKQLWIRKIEKEYERLLSQKKISYDAWVRKQEEKNTENVQSAGSEKQNEVVDKTAEYVLFQQKRGRLSDHAPGFIAEYFAEHPQVKILYGDEDFLTEKNIRENPWFKPCWSPDAYLSQFYVGSVIAVRRELLEEAQVEEKILFDSPEEIRPIITECICQCGGFDKGCIAIARCPHILFHVTDTHVWEEYLSSENQSPCMPEDMLDVSVIIPSKDNPDILEKCLNSLRQISGLEIIIVDNGSNKENRREIESLIEGLNVNGSAGQNIRYLYHSMDFNFSKMCNMGADTANGKYLLFLNDDIEACGTEWIYEMKTKAQKPYIGAVGLKLYYPGGVKIQHSGITNLPVGPVHKMQFFEDDQSIYFDRNRANMNCLAVTGACLMIDKDKYAEVGGFKESLRVAYNDVDLGFALYEAGYQNVVINSFYAYHHESLSRGSDESKEKQARLQKEREHLYQLHPALQGKDPYYPSGLSRIGLDSRIVPDYINVLNTIQEACADEMVVDLAQVRVDNCLLIGIEQGNEAYIRGYSVVLGDNNACYDRYVVLAEPDKPSGETVPMLMVKTESQYRQDLEENIPDQKNVALCGFHIHFPEEKCVKLVKGAEYRIGVLAVHKINKGKLFNWSSRYFTV